MGKVKELPDGRRMLGGGCESCPVEACATSTYRGSACASQRALYGLGDPLTNGDRIRAMSDAELGSWLCSIMANCDEKCPGRNWCKTGHKGTVAWLKQPVKEET